MKQKSSYQYHHDYTQFPYSQISTSLLCHSVIQYIVTVMLQLVLQVMFMKCAMTTIPPFIKIIVREPYNLFCMFLSFYMCHI